MKKRGTVISVILGFLLLAFLPSAAQEEPGPAPVPGQGRGPMLQKWLDLTPEQMTKLKELRGQRQEAMKGLQEQQEKMHQELQELMDNPKADQNRVAGLIDDLAKLQADRMKSNFKFRQDMQKILTPQQLEKLQKARTAMRGIGDGYRFLMRHPGARRFMADRLFRGRGFNRRGRMGFRGPGLWDQMLWEF